VLERVPEATVVFFGPEDSTVARGAVAAGARGLIRGGEREDLVVSVAKGLMLLLRGSRRVDVAANGVNGTGANGNGANGNGANGNGASGAVVNGAASAANGANGAMPLPLQRSEAGEGEEGEEPGDGTESEEGDQTEAGDEAVALDATVAVGSPGTATVEGVRRLALTERELQVLRGMADGKSNAEIGRELFVSEDTVKTHARRLFRKLGARDRAHAVAAAFRAGLVR
jgi:DNA-binding CsgD family transcriptional regulator